MLSNELIKLYHVYGFFFFLSCNLLLLLSYLAPGDPSTSHPGSIMLITFSSGARASLLYSIGEWTVGDASNMPILSLKRRELDSVAGLVVNPGLLSSCIGARNNLLPWNLASDSSFGISLVSGSTTVGFAAPSSLSFFCMLSENCD